MIRGYHVYYKFENKFREIKDNKYDAINVLIQLVSVLYWKENYGPMRLIANQEHLDSILKYKIFEEYDGIDLHLLTRMPHKDKASRYWSFSKIFVARELSKMYNEFCIFDTDLWIKGKNLIDKGYDFHVFHKENFDTDSKYNMYHDPSNWLDLEDINRFNWNYWPLNAAILHFKNRTRELIDNWYDESIKIISYNKEIDDEKIERRSSLFIEQRLLPVIARKLGISYGTIKPNVYRACLYMEEMIWNKRWIPNISSSEESLKIEDEIQHIWGKKFLYDNPHVRISILLRLLADLDHFNGIKEKYKELFDEINLILEESYNEI
jgi:hypothetical protein